MKIEELSSIIEQSEAQIEADMSLRVYEEWLARSVNDISVEELIQHVDDYTLSVWDHYTHVRLAWVSLSILTVHFT